MAKFRSTKFSKSLLYALNGWRLSVKTQKNIKRHILIITFVLAISLAIRVDVLSLCVIILANVIPLIAEMFNSVTEFLVDSYYKNKWAKLAKMAKDVAAGAVLLASCTSALITFLLWFNKIYSIYFAS